MFLLLFQFWICDLIFWKSASGSWPFSPLEGKCLFSNSSYLEEVFSPIAVNCPSLLISLCNSETLEIVNNGPPNFWELNAKRSFLFSGDVSKLTERDLTESLDRSSCDWSLDVLSSSNLMSVWSCCNCLLALNAPPRSKTA